MSWTDWIKTKLTGRPAGESAPRPEPAGERDSRPDPRAGLDPAIAKLDAAIAQLPDGPKKLGLYFERGLAYKALGVTRKSPDDLERALADFARVGKVLPALADVYGNRGECLVRLSKHEAAVDSLDRAIALLPPSPPGGLATAHILRGQARAALGDRDGAIADFTRAAEIAPELTADIEQERTRALDSAPEARPAPSAVADERDVLRATWELDQRGDQVGALVAFGTAIARAPSASAYYGRGVINCKLRRHAEAIADLDRAVELRPRFPAALTERGLARLESGDIDHAIADYDAAIAIDPALGAAHENKGLALLHKKRWADAVPCLDTALRITPSNASLRYHRGLAHEMLGDLPRALRDLQDSIRHGKGQEHVRFAEQRLAGLRPRAAGLPEPGKPEPESLWPVLTGISLDTTVAELATRAHAEDRFFGQLDLPGGNRTFVPFHGKYGLWRRLTEIADVIGPRILPLTLGQFDDLLGAPDDPDDGAAPAPAPEPGPGRGDVERLVEGAQLHVLTNGGQVLGVYTPGIAHHELDLPTSLCGARPIFGRTDRPDPERRCASCQRAVAYFDAVLDHDKLAGYACPHCGASPIASWTEERMAPGQWSRAGFLGPTERLHDVIDRDDRTLQRLGLGHARLADALDHLLTHAFQASADQIGRAGARFEEQMRAAGTRGNPGLAVLPLGATLDELEAQLGRGEPLPAERGTAVDGHDVFLQIYVSYQYCPFTILRLPWSDESPARVILRRQTAGVAYVTEPTDRHLPCGAGKSYRHANLEFLIVRRDTRQALRGSGLLVHLIRDHRFFEGEHSPFRLDPERAAQVLGLV